MARAMASICNDERASYGVMSGHDRKILSLSDGGSRDPALEPVGARDVLPGLLGRLHVVDQLHVFGVDHAGVHQVFLKLAKGETAGRIADHLSLSVKTVSTYRTRMMEKMNLSSNSDLTYYALKHGLIQ